MNKFYGRVKDLVEKKSNPKRPRAIVRIVPGYRRPTGHSQGAPPRPRRRTAAAKKKQEDYEDRVQHKSNDTTQGT